MPHLSQQQSAFVAQTFLCTCQLHPQFLYLHRVHSQYHAYSMCRLYGTCYTRVSCRASEISS